MSDVTGLEPRTFDGRGETSKDLFRVHVSTVLYGDTYSYRTCV